MRLIGLMPVRNESWAIGLTLRVALQWCDKVIVLLHGCTDNSEDIALEALREGGKSFSVLTEPLDRWDEMRHRQWLLEKARERGATHIAIVDADEFLTANLVPRIRQVIETTPPGYMLELPGYNTRERPPAVGLQYHLNGIWGNRWFATAFQDMPSLHWAGDRFHKREPFGYGWNRVRPFQQGQGGTIHLWGASERRLRAKHAWYRITERLRWPDKPVAEIDRYYSLATEPQPEHVYDHRGRWLNSIAPRPWTFEQVPSGWLAGYEEWIDKYLHLDAVPWQEECIRTVLETHGREHFAGLNLLGY